MLYTGVLTSVFTFLLDVYEMASSYLHFRFSLLVLLLFMEKKAEREKQRKATAKLGKAKRLSLC